MRDSDGLRGEPPDRWFDALFADPGAFVGLLDTDGTLRRVNDAALRFVDATETDVVGQPFWTLPWWDQSDEQREELVAAIGRAADGEFVRFDAENYGVDDTVTLTVSLRPLRDADGDVDAVLAEGIDITEETRTLAERQLLQQVIRETATAETTAEALRTVVDTICRTTPFVYGEAWLPDDAEGRLEPSPIWHGSDAGHRTFRELSASFTFAPDEGLPGRTWASAAPIWLADLPTGDEDPFCRAAEVAAAGFESAVGIPVCHDGSVIVVLVFFLSDRRKRDEQLLDLLSTVATEMGTLIDRQQSQVALADERQLLARVLDTAPVGLAVLDQDGRLVRASGEFERVVERTGIESLGELFDSQHVEIVTADGDRLSLENSAARRTIETGESVSDVELRVQFPDGERRWYSLDTAPLRGEGTGGVILSVVDVTNLERQNQRLTRHRQRLSVLNRVLRHDIRTRVNIIEGYTDLLADRDPAARPLAAVISRTANDLLELSDAARLVESTLDEPSPTYPVDVVALLERCLSTVEEAFPHAAVTLSAPAEARVLATDRLAFAFQQLVENAIVHNDAETPRVDIDVSCRAASARPQVVVRIVDNGPGIPAHERRLLGNEETQLDHSDGFGLWLSYWLVDAVDGDIDLADDGNGTTVTVTLPAAPAS